MSLKDVEIRPEYNSVVDDVYRDFFNPVLGQSRQCARIGGRFTSRNLAACAEGMQEFIMADGTMKLAMLPEFKEEDIGAINRGTRGAPDVLSDGWIRDMSEIREKFVEDHVRALAWMLASGNLEIRIVIPVGRDGRIIAHAPLEESQVFKRKTGIFWDADRNAVSFSGNIEFDDKLLGEYYHFRAYRGWDPGERKYVEKDYGEFRRYWDGPQDPGGGGLRSMPLPDAVRDRLIRIAPKSRSEIRLQSMPKLRPYQREAVGEWARAGHRGVFEMATGTGKTFAAIGCINEVRRGGRKTLVVVACPFDNLERQWQAALERWGIGAQVTSGNARWHTRMRDGLAAFRKSDQSDILVVITSYSTLRSEKFLRSVERCGVDAMLVADEVHNAGSAALLAGLSGAYGYRLGLSATIERYFDPGGTAALRSFFGDTVFAMGLEQAIECGFLVGYNYHPAYAELAEDEYLAYKKYTRTIAMLWSSKDPKDRHRLEAALHMRSRIVLNAASKLEWFREWIAGGGGEVKYTLVYCSESQMPEVKRMLSESGVVNREITAANPQDPLRRAGILREFSDGLYGAIVANRVLDEGADVPAARTCVMLASTGNPKQFIQRRGRVLRQFPQGYRDGSRKDHADIYDVIIMPSMSGDYTADEAQIERQIAASQIRRQEMMAGAALNREECMEEVRATKARFRL